MEGGGCHGARQSCRQGLRLRPVGPLLSQVPLPHPSSWHAWTRAHQPLQDSFCKWLGKLSIEMSLPKLDQKKIRQVRSLLPCTRARVGAERKCLSREAICCPALSGGKGMRSTLEAINTEQLVDDFIAG